jgi:hypothetical protein
VTVTLIGALALMNGTVPFVRGQAEGGRLELTVVEKGEPVACRVHLADGAGKPVRAPGLPFWRDHFVCDGRVALDLPAGKYAFTVERGPEYSSASDAVAVAAGETARRTVELKRIADLKSEGWWSGDLHVHRALEEIPLHLRAEDLHVAPVITWWNNRNLWAGKEIPADLLVRPDADRLIHVMAGEDEREGGALLYFGLKRPLALAGATREHPSPVAFLREARAQAGVHVDIEKPFWWDVPVWLSTGAVDTIGVANNHQCRSQMLESEAWGKPRDPRRWPAPRGNGFWTQEIYYHALNCGLRIPPSAGSASGVLPNPVGYNRAYVRVEGPLTYEAWFEGLRAGRSFVTNGPLLRARAGGHWPGHVFTSAGPVEIEVTATVEGRDRVPAVEVVREGRVEPLGKLRFERSGWFLVRAVADNEKTFRFASTAPWYVEVAGKPAGVSRASAKFFADWVEERIGRIKEADPRKREEVLEPHLKARAFWEELFKKADVP